MSDVSAVFNTRRMSNSYRDLVGPIFALYALTFLVFLPVCCRHWPHSPYFTSSKDGEQVVRQVVRNNDERFALSRRYLENLRLQQPSSKWKAENISPRETYELVIGVVTMNRDNGGTSMYNAADERYTSDKGKMQSLELGYLIQTVVRLMEMINASSSNSFHHSKLFVCNVDPVPSRYREPEEFKDFVEIVTRYKNASAVRVNRAYHSQDIFEREKDDYAFCLEQAVAVGTSADKPAPPQYVMLVEDDVLFHQHSLDALASILRHQPRDTGIDTSLADRADSWLFLKLYYPEKWLGYGNEFDRVLELICVAAIGAGFGGIIAAALLKRRRCLQTLVICSAFAGYFTLVCLGLGRPHARAWRDFVGLYRTVEAPDCCTQAVLYPSRAVKGLVEHLTYQRCTEDYSVDIAIAGYARLMGLKTYLIDPNMAQHIGFVSSVRQYSKRVADFL